MRIKSKKSQYGAEILEFVVIVLFFLILLFSVFQWAVVFYKWNGLAEAARRGARMAAVCPYNLEQVKNIAVYNTYADDGVASPIVGGLLPGDVTVRYLDEDGIEVDDSKPPGDYLSDLTFVQVEIDYRHQFFLAGFDLLLQAPAFRTTLPAESKGAVPTYPGEPVDPDAPRCNF